MVPSAVIFTFLQLCSLHLLVVSMPTTCLLAGHVVQDTHRMLNELGEPFPLHCLSFNANISFPDSALPAASANHSQCRRALWVVYESLREAELLFADYDLPEGVGGVSWDKKKLDRFLSLQNRLVEDGICLSSVDSSGVLSPYFRNVTTYVEQQVGCGWELLRRDLLWVLKSALRHHRLCFKW